MSLPNFGASILRRGNVADFSVISAVETLIGGSSSFANSAGGLATAVAIEYRKLE